jgi:hypothetical protein
MYSTSTIVKIQRKYSRMGASSYPCDQSDDEGNRRRIICSQSIISCCDAAPVFEPAEEAFDDVSSSVCFSVERIWGFASGR